jgi:uncharacterized cofD-like protein
VLPPREPNIVVIGGGTGSYAALMGLKHRTSKLTAIISMADSGGSTGRLRDEFGHLPPGDLRKALVALASDDEASLMLRALFEYRFEKGDGLSGHTFGNLFLTALTELTGGTDQAVKEASKVLNIRGRVIPVTLTDTHLVAETADGRVIRGETNIDTRSGEDADVPITGVCLDPPAEANPDAVEAVERADVVLLGPGDLYSSIIPNLLVPGIPEALRRSSALKVYVVNIMTKHGETDGFTASSFIRQIKRYLGAGATLDYALANVHEQIPLDVMERYERDRSQPVTIDPAECHQLVKNLRVRPLTTVGAYVRHDPRLLADAVMEVYEHHVGAKHEAVSRAT